MTVGELLDHLKQFPDHWTVFTGIEGSSEEDQDLANVIQEQEDDAGNPEICIIHD